MKLEKNFKFTEATAHSGLHYPPFISVPHLTSYLQAVGTPLFIVPTPFFPLYPCVCVSPIPGTVSKDFKQALKTCTFQKASEPLASFNWRINKTTLWKPKMKQAFPSHPPKNSCWLPGIKLFPYSELRSTPLYILGILIVKKEHSSVLSRNSIRSISTGQKLLQDTPAPLRQKGNCFIRKKRKIKIALHSI